MPTDLPQPAILYGSLLFLGGVICLIHFAFFLKAPRSIDTTRPGLPPWRLKLPEFLLGLFAIVLVALVVVNIVAFLTAEMIEHEVTQVVFLGSALHLTALVGLFAFSRIYPEKFQASFNSRSMSWGRALGLALYAYLITVPVLYPLSAGWQYLLNHLGHEPEAQEVVRLFAQADTPALLLPMIVLTAVVAPLSEELLFRGCLYRFLKAKISLWFALVLSGLLFAMLHHNLLSLFPLFILGIILAYVYERTGSLKVPILMHGIFNGNTIIVIVLTEHLS